MPCHFDRRSWREKLLTKGQHGFINRPTAKSAECPCKYLLSPTPGHGSERHEAARRRVANKKLEPRGSPGLGVVAIYSRRRTPIRAATVISCAPSLTIDVKASYRISPRPESRNSAPVAGRRFVVPQESRRVFPMHRTQRWRAGSRAGMEPATRDSAKAHLTQGCRYKVLFWAFQSEKVTAGASKHPRGHAQSRRQGLSPSWDGGRSGGRGRSEGAHRKGRKTGRTSKTWGPAADLTRDWPTGSLIPMIVMLRSCRAPAQTTP